MFVLLCHKEGSMVLTPAPCLLRWAMRRLSPSSVRLVAIRVISSCWTLCINEMGMMGCEEGSEGRGTGAWGAAFVPSGDVISVLCCLQKQESVGYKKHPHHPCYDL